MLIQQKAMEELANIREEVQDLCHEAAAKKTAGRNRRPAGSVYAAAAAHSIMIRLTASNAGS